MNRFCRILRNRPEPAPPTPEQVLADLAPRFREALISMYRGELDGHRHAIDPLTKIFPSQGMWLYDLCRREKPAATLEIGKCYGFSTLFFLAALVANGSGRHTAIDPNERSHWHGIALAHAQKLGMGSIIRFIDGSHRFDDVTADFYLYAPLCMPGSLINFDDTWMSSIQTAVAFVRSDRLGFAGVPASESNVSVFRRIAEDAREWAHFQPFAVAAGVRR